MYNKKRTFNSFERVIITAHRTYIAIDLKSFYASVECVERGLDPLTANLVVADVSRTEKTICLAVSPSLKKYGIPGRARLFEVNEAVRQINYGRRAAAPGHTFTGKSSDANMLESDPSLELDFIAAPPQMAHYMNVSTKIYGIYLKYIAPEDMHVYSIDEVFMDVTDYLGTYKMTARELAAAIIRDVLDTTGITATAGIGTNLYLCKVAMDIVAKHIPADENGVRIAELDEMSYRKLLWDHRPLTDFWRVGPGIARKLEHYYIRTMGDIARYSLENEDLLYRLFGKNTELLIDHAWGYEPCTIADIKAYKPSAKSISSGQVLQFPHDCEQTRLIIKEMADMLALDLVEKRLAANQIGLAIGYDTQNLRDSGISRSYKGEIKTDYYGRKIPKGVNSTINLERYTSSARLITEAAMKLYDRITDENLLVRRITISANKVISESDIPYEQAAEQLDLFTDHFALSEQREREDRALMREKNMQTAILAIKNRYGKNAIVKGMNLQSGATAMERNRQIGGHRA